VTTNNCPFADRLILSGLAGMALGICQRVTLVVVGKCRVARSQHIVRFIIGVVGGGYADSLPLRSITGRMQPIPDPVIHIRPLAG